jgi:hypothetical protein
MVGLLVVAALAVVGCSGKPGVSGLRDSFAEQLAANHAVMGFHRRGDDLLFSGPTPDGTGVATWRVHIDTATVEANTDEQGPYKGIVTSTWYENGQPVRPSVSGRDSNLPVALTSNGLAQACWAFWDPTTKKWGW